MENFIHSGYFYVLLGFVLVVIAGLIIFKDRENI